MKPYHKRLFLLRVSLVGGKEKERKGKERQETVNYGFCTWLVWSITRKLLSYDVRWLVSIQPLEVSRIDQTVKWIKSFFLKIYLGNVSVDLKNRCDLAIESLPYPNIKAVKMDWWDGQARNPPLNWPGGRPFRQATKWPTQLNPSLAVRPVRLFFKKIK